MCTWVNSPNVLEDEFDWTRGSGGTPSQFTGPKIDHTTGSAKGQYLLSFFCFCIFAVYLSLQSEC